MNYSVQFVSGHSVSPVLRNTMYATGKTYIGIITGSTVCSDYFFNLVKENSHTYVSCRYMIDQHLKQKIIKLLKIGSFSTG